MEGFGGSGSREGDRSQLGGAQTPWGWQAPHKGVQGLRVRMRGTLGGWWDTEGG